MIVRAVKGVWAHREPSIYIPLIHTVEAEF
eukprot:COSAG02_NODE_3100_length_7376_cov_112.354267_7_plen_29_part_01